MKEAILIAVLSALLWWGMVVLPAKLLASPCYDNMTYQQFVRCSQWQQQRNLNIQRQKARPHTNKQVQRTPSNPGSGKLYFPPRKKQPKQKMIGRGK